MIYLGSRDTGIGELKSLLEVGGGRLSNVLLALLDSVVRGLFKLSLELVDLLGECLFMCRVLQVNKGD